MSRKSKIEWTNNTWNPVTGCSKVSEGCKNCYAERDWKRLSAPTRGLPLKHGNTRNIYTGRPFTDVRCHPERLDQPLRWKKPKRIFVNSMSDLFHESVPEPFLNEIFGVMSLCPQHTFQILTKRPERMMTYLSQGDIEDLIRDGQFQIAKEVVDPWEYEYEIEEYPLPNVWLGVSVEDQHTADERIPLLLQTPVEIRWVSVEPLLGSVNLSSFLYGKIDWAVCGGESGPNARPMRADWARSVRDQCIAADVPFFFKQWGEWAPTSIGMRRVGKKKAGRALDGRYWDEYPTLC